MKTIFLTYILILLSTNFISAQFSDSEDNILVNDRVQISEDLDNLYISLKVDNETEDCIYTFEMVKSDTYSKILSKFNVTPDSGKSIYKLVNKLPEEDAIYRIYRYSNSKVTLVTEYHYLPKSQFMVSKT
jgi:hypothetical protein